MIFSYEMERRVLTLLPGKSFRKLQKYVLPLRETRTKKLRALYLELKFNRSAYASCYDGLSYLLSIEKPDGTVLLFETPLRRWRTLENYEKQEDLLFEEIADQSSPIVDVKCLRGTEEDWLKEKDLSGDPCYESLEITLLFQPQ